MNDTAGNVSGHLASITPRLVRLIRDPLHLIESHVVIPRIVQSRRPRRFVPGHLLRDFELAAILQVRRDARCPEAVAGDLRPDPGSNGAALDHGIDVLLGKGKPAHELAVPQSREEGTGRSPKPPVASTSGE